MPAYPILILDTYPLGNAIVRFAKPGDTPTESELCRRWVEDCQNAGASFLVPAIAYYEGLRELEQRSVATKIPRFQSFCLDPNRFIPLTTDHLTEAAKLWGNLRRTGQATSDPKALDGDAIFAAQVLSLGYKQEDYVVVTRNPGHLQRFGLFTEAWENIPP
jgi:predicted nucleic acid-binding protein